MNFAGTPACQCVLGTILCPNTTRMSVLHAMFGDSSLISSRLSRMALRCLHPTMGNLQRTACVVYASKHASLHVLMLSLPYLLDNTALTAWDALPGQACRARFAALLVLFRLTLLLYSCLSTTQGNLSH